MAAGSRSTSELLTEAQFHLELAVEYARSDVEEQRTLDAMSMRLSAGVETLSHLDPGVRDRLFGRTWRWMWGMRNRIAHGYLLINADMLHATVAQDLPEVLDIIRAELEASPGT